MQRKINDVIVVGAGPAGLFAARRLAKNGMHVTVLEKEPRVGGKCFTYSDPDQPEVKAEWGATLILPNYSEALDVIQEKNIELEECLPADPSSVEIVQQFQSLNWMGKISFVATFAVELARYTYAVSCYQYARNHLQELPPDYELPFASFAKKYNMEKINVFLKSFVTAFGYGLMEECPTYCVMEYTGTASIPAILAGPLRSGMVGIKNGFQTVMQKIAEDLDVVTSAEITNVQRNQHEVSVTYQLPDHSVVVKKADALVLALSPVQWSTLGMKLTDTEQHCVDALNYYHYPIAIVEVDGAEPKNLYLPAGLEKSGLGHAALFATRDNRHTQRRVGTAFVNLPEHDHMYSFDEKTKTSLCDELKTALHANSVNIIDHKIWEDYMPTLSWQDRLQLEGEQMLPSVNTLYVGAYAAGGFDNVACVTEQATKAVDKYMTGVEVSSFEKTKKDLSLASFFYRQPRVPAFSDRVPRCRLG